MVVEKLRKELGRTNSERLTHIIVMKLANKDITCRLAIFYMATSLFHAWGFYFAMVCLIREKLAHKNKEKIIKKMDGSGGRTLNFGLTSQKINHYTITDAIKTANIGILFFNFL